MKKARDFKQLHPKRLDIAELNEALQDGKIEIGQRVRLQGKFSEYVPFANLVGLMNKTDQARLAGLPRTPRSCTLAARDGLNCGSLFLDKETLSPYDVAIPVSYGQNTALSGFSTGTATDLEGCIVSLPARWSKLLAADGFYSLRKRNSNRLPYGIRVERAKKKRMVNEFRINAWLVFHPINPKRTAALLNR